jgi:hypothetical protein
MITNENMDNKIGSNSPEANLMAEEQVARLAANLLNDNAQHLNAVTLQRLSVARELAVNKLATRQTQAASHHGINQSGNVLQWLGYGFGAYFEQHRMMSSVIIAAAMLLAFFAAQQFHFDNNFGLNHNLENSDAFLLASELPPEAFADKGFDTWLVSKQD